MRAAAAGMSAILDTEIGLHIAYCRGWGLGEAEMAALPESPACIAYTRFVLERGMAGDLLDLHVALPPFVSGYAALGQWLAAVPAHRRACNPYVAWIDNAACPVHHDVPEREIASSPRPTQRTGEAG